MTSATPISVAIIGAGGKMGCRIVDNLKNDPGYRLLCVEVGAPGIANLEKRGLAPVPRNEALAQADAAVLALPDNLIGRLSAEIVAAMKPGAMVVCLDPAAPCAGKVAQRADLAYFATHPCHPPVWNDETDPEARRDFFGGIKAKQHIVCALFQGKEADYARGEALARRMFAPVMSSYRVTVQQMAILEPALSETTVATCLVVMKEAMDEAIRRGVPADAARAFTMGHINIAMAIAFGEISAPFSDAARKAIEQAKAKIFRPDWKNVFEPDSIRESLDMITREPEAR